jgi:hypothetical protein
VDSEMIRTGDYSEVYTDGSHHDQVSQWVMKFRRYSDWFESSIVFTLGGNCLLPLRDAFLCWTQSRQISTTVHTVLRAFVVLCVTRSTRWICIREHILQFLLLLLVVFLCFFEWDIVDVAYTSWWWQLWGRILMKHEHVLSLGHNYQNSQWNNVNKRETPFRLFIFW